MRARQLTLALFVATGLTAMTGCGGAPTAVRTVTAAAPTSSSPAATTPAATTTAPAPPAVTTPVAVPTTPTPAAPTTFTMPDEVGMVLQDAQDNIQAVSGNPAYFTTSSDATGAGRSQILDANWQVCAQSVPAGTTLTDGDAIDFSVVKLEESCP